MPPVEEQYDPDGDLPVQREIRGLEPGRLLYHKFRSVLIEYQPI